MSARSDSTLTRTTQFEGLRVADVMHGPPCTCGPEASLASVAYTMATRHIHAVVVAGLGEDAGDRPWGIVSALDVAAAAAHPGSRRTAADTAATEVLTIDSGEPVSRAAQLMAEHDLTHLVVVGPGSELPVGIVSTLDIARAYADPGHA